MADENALQDEAQKIEKLVAANKASDISLDQPYPQEIASQKGPIAEIVAEHEYEAAQAEEKKPPEPPKPEANAGESAPETPESDTAKLASAAASEATAVKKLNEQEAQPPPEEKSKEESSPAKPEEKPPESEEEPAKAGGYTVTDILQAPVKPPENLEGEPKSATKYPKVKFLIGVGVTLFFLGILFFLLFDPFFGFVVAFVGGLLVMAAVFLPLHKMGKKKPGSKSEAKA